MDWKRKFTSRKFLLSVAAFLASVTTLINSMYTGNPTLTAVALLCGIISAGIYAFAESVVDSANKTDVLEDEAVG